MLKLFVDVWKNRLQTIKKINISKKLNNKLISLISNPIVRFRLIYSKWSKSCFKIKHTQAALMRLSSKLGNQSDHQKSIK